MIKLNWIKHSWLLVLLLGCSEKKESTQLPNIVLILADDLGYNDLSFYRQLHDVHSENSPTCQTPNIDKLAEEGMYFTDFYSGAAVCSPSRAALLTGRNSTRLGIYNWIPGSNPMHLRDGEMTIAELVKQKNYSTAHFGKWHLTSGNMPQPEPMDQGYDYAFWTENNAIPSHENPVNFFRNRDEVGELEGYSCHIVVNEAIKWLENQNEERNPFYINLWFHEPHSKEAAPDSLKARHNRNMAYYGCIENMDYAVGNFINYLKESGIYDNTLILFTSDNGSQYLGSNLPFRGEKCFQYEGGIRVPFIASWKGKIDPGSISGAIGHFTDVFPTVGEIVQAQVPEGLFIDGESLFGTLQGTDPSYEREDPIFFYRYFHDPICMIRKGDYVLLGYQNEPKSWQLNYDEVSEALFKPAPEEPKWSQWGFQKNHMEAIKLQEPGYFELYNIIDDIGQHIDISLNNPGLTDELKRLMLQKQKEMVREGGDWYENDFNQ
jgi:arylsulfatase A